MRAPGNAFLALALAAFSCGCATTRLTAWLDRRRQSHSPYEVCGASIGQGTLHLLVVCLDGSVIHAEVPAGDLRWNGTEGPTMQIVGEAGRDETLPGTPVRLVDWVPVLGLGADTIAVSRPLRTATDGRWLAVEVVRADACARPLLPALRGPTTGEVAVYISLLLPALCLDLATSPAQGLLLLIMVGVWM